MFTSATKIWGPNFILLEIFRNVGYFIAAKWSLTFILNSWQVSIFLDIFLEQITIAPYGPSKALQSEIGIFRCCTADAETCQW